MNKENASLTVVGSGIKSISHITVEAKVHIERSERLFFMVATEVIANWIMTLNPKAEPLDSIYFEHPLRIDCYRAITSFLIEEVKKPQHVCVVLYGHPTVFAMPALNAVNALKREHYNAWILPGISAEDCLFADLCIDPSTDGCQSFEATSFLKRPYQYDPNCHLVLWQVGVIGCAHHPSQDKDFDNRKGVAVLRDLLAKRYGRNHEVILYEAATFPHDKPKIEPVPLKDLTGADFSLISTLYVPPLEKRAPDPKMVAQLANI